MSVAYLRSIGFKTTGKVVKKKFDMKEHIEDYERRDWMQLINEIYAFWNDYKGNYKNNVKKAILHYKDEDFPEAEEYSIKLVRNNIPLMFGKTSTLFFSGDVNENLKNLSQAIKDGHLDSAIKSHYLSVMRKKKAADKAREKKAKEEVDRLEKLEERLREERVR